MKLKHLCLLGGGRLLSSRLFLGSCLLLGGGGLLSGGLLGHGLLLRRLLGGSGLLSSRLFGGGGFLGGGLLLDNLGYLLHHLLSGLLFLYDLFHDLLHHLLFRGGLLRLGAELVRALHLRYYSKNAKIGRIKCKQSRHAFGAVKANT